MKKTKKNPWGYDLSSTDTSVRPQDDFYHYVNGNWIKENPIPPTESHWGGFNLLALETEKKLHGIVTGLLATKRAVKGSPEQMIRDLYRSAIDMDTRNTLGASPLIPWQKKIAALEDDTDLKAIIAEFHKLSISAGWGIGVDQDMKNSERYSLYIGQDGLGLPDRDYYLNDDANTLTVRAAYVTHVRNIFKLIGYTSAVAVKYAEIVLAFETRLARASMKKEDVRDPDKIYHKMTLKKLMRQTPALDWDIYLKRMGLRRLDEVIVMQPDFLMEVARMLTDVSIEDWKIYLEWQLASDFSGALSMPFLRENFNFSTVLTGSKKMRPMWRQALDAVNGNLGELLGQLYVKKYFSSEAKRTVNEMVDDLFTAYEAHIRKLTWMSEPTKRKALKKLLAIERKIGYPSKWKRYTGLVIEPKEYVGNLIRSTEFGLRRSFRKLGKPIDRTEWFMNPQTVNAYFAPTMNDIVFPAGILQWPFFDVDSDAAINYGSMGWCIGHEFTHGFDDEGGKFDHSGNLKMWWTPNDYKEFEKLAKRIEEQYDRYTVADGVHVNGKLTLGENIADLGGMSIAFDAYQLYLGRHGRKDLDGFSPEQRFFLGFAQGDREITRPEAAKTRIMLDPHSPAIFRINGPLENFPAFYDAFGVKEGDGMYRAPKARTEIW